MQENENQVIDIEIKEIKQEPSEQEISLKDVIKNLSDMDKKIEQMNQLFIQKIQHTTHEEKIVDQMHTELQKYKGGMYFDLIRPILLDIIEVRNSIRKMSIYFISKSENEQNSLLEQFSSYALEDIEDILEKNNVTIYDSNEGEIFDAHKQSITKKEVTSTEQLHGKIANSLSSGYCYKDKVISREKVSVYVYQKQEDEKGEM